ncbi:hypothetical protein F5Y12DRAFT_611062 [Xylaria sp. FL1777]|nr:hypothetical protein F5Y12DRAFT_611062 [Xylaria sp. FL1777]
MPDNYKDGGIRGFGLQCPWSNCFPQLYKHSKNPCTLTPFADFREMTDHIWKYHSCLLSCNNCDHRFLNARRTQGHLSALDKLKKNHLESVCTNLTPNPEHYIKTMTDTQDKILKRWKPKNINDEALAKPHYYSLCHSLFGDGVQLPEDHKYHYFLPEYTVNKASDQLGKINLEYIKQRQSTTDNEPTSSSSHQEPRFTTYCPQPMQSTINPLLLDDEGAQPCDWTVHQPGPDHDSAYGSGGTGESALQQSASTDMDYMPHLVWPQLSMPGFSQDALDERPPSITEGNWELEDYDGSSG